jgi:hypothetical protein
MRFHRARREPELFSPMTKPSASRGLARRAPPVLRHDDVALAKLAELGAIQCTVAEAAQIFGVPDSRMTNFFARNGRARTAFEQGRALVIEQPRITQFKLAQTSPTMAVFLGKHYLGQADRREWDQSAAIEASEAAPSVRNKLAAFATAPQPAGDRHGGSKVR